MLAGSRSAATWLWNCSPRCRRTTIRYGARRWTSLLANKRTVSVPLTVIDPMFQRVEYRLESDGDEAPLLRYSVPFELRGDFVDLVPLNLQHKLVVKPAYTLYRNQLQTSGFAPGQDRGTAARSGRRHGCRASDHQRCGMCGSTSRPRGRGVIIACSWRHWVQRVKPQSPAKRSSIVHAHPLWALEPDEHQGHVLPPFEPVTVKQTAEGIALCAWGRTYRYGNAMLPKSIAAGGGVNDLLEGPLTILADGQTVDRRINHHQR